MARLSNNWRSERATKRSYNQYDTKEPRDNSWSQWEAGDIAYLREAREFNAADHDELISTKYLHIKAAGHPVVILARAPNYEHYLVTTISAYGSSAANNFLAPWNQKWHSRKEVDGFRAFEGSERPNNKFPLLRLADGRYCPKIRTSWVYVHNAYVVPATTLKFFDKTPHQLRLTSESLSDLLSHMEVKSRMYQTGIRSPKLNCNTCLNPGCGDKILPKRAKSSRVNGKPPTPPSSCPSSPDSGNSYARILKKPTVQTMSPPPSPPTSGSWPQTPESPETKPSSSPSPEPAPRPLSTPIATKGSPTPSSSTPAKPLWSSIAAGPATSAPVSPQTHQQQRQQQPKPQPTQGQQTKKQANKVPTRRANKTWA
ncbi:hypothetical protein F4810DRAFT_710607 [Camillea tinctor]|nr:hypothetical protein F4810DRAFT_710607 [Camillea tinctor]